MTQRYAVVGAGSRASLYVNAITGTYADRATLVAICEPNPVRAALYVDAVDAGVSGSLRPEGERLLLQRHWEAPAEIEIPGAAGGHGGGDALLLSDVFVGPSDDPLARPADWRDGVRSIAVGIAGNVSLETGLPVQVSDLGIHLLAQPTP